MASSRDNAHIEKEDIQLTILMMDWMKSCTETFTIFKTVLSSMEADICYFVAAKETVEARKV